MSGIVAIVPRGEWRMKYNRQGKSDEWTDKKETTNGMCHLILLKAKGNRNYPESFSGRE